MFSSMLIYKKYKEIWKDSIYKGYMFYKLVTGEERSKNQTTCTCR